MNTVFLFAGQGSQFYGMGRNLYDSNDTFKHSVDYLDDLIYFHMGFHVKDVMLGHYHDRSEKFIDFLNSSFAIYIFEYASAQMMIQSGILPDSVLGCSLGEMAAQTIAGTMLPEDVIHLIAGISKVIKRHNRLGGMLSIIESPSFFERKDIFADCEIVSINHDNNFVVSGCAPSISNLKKVLSAENVAFLEFPVNVPFHSSLIDVYEEDYLSVSDYISYGNPRCIIYSCVTGETVDKIDGQYIWNVLRYPIRWNESIQNNLAMKDVLFVDLSPDAQLASLLKYNIKSNGNVFKVSNLFNAPVSIPKVVESIKKYRKV